jgi:protocatechuate 4,5-dioxygenase alpha chain
LADRRTCREAAASGPTADCYFIQWLCPGDVEFRRELKTTRICKIDYKRLAQQKRMRRRGCKPNRPYRRSAARAREIVRQIDKDQGPSAPLRISMVVRAVIGRRKSMHGIEIPGTPIFDGAQARKGYALNKMCFSFNREANRREFLRDEKAYCTKYRLTPAQRAAVEHRNVLEMIEAGGNVYYLAKLAGIFGLSVQDIGAQQAGVTVDDFKAKLQAAGR